MERPRRWCVCGDPDCADAHYPKGRADKVDAYMDHIQAERDILQAQLTGQYDAYMDALKAEHDTFVNTGHPKTARGTTRAMMIIGEIHDAHLNPPKEKA